MKILLKILPILSFVLAILAFVLTLTVFRESADAVYYDMYWMNKAGCAFLIAVPLCVVALALGIKRKDRVAIIISLVISIIAIAISVGSYSKAQKYSFDEENLLSIEKKTNISFSDNASIIVDNTVKNVITVDGKTFECASEGAIWFEEDDSFIDAVNSDNRWTTAISENAKKIISLQFETATMGCEYYFCENVPENEIIIMAYDKDRNEIYFSCFKIIQ